MKNSILIVIIAILSILLVGFAYVSQDKELCCEYNFCANITETCEEQGTEITSEKGIKIKLNNIKEGDTVEVGFKVEGSVTGSWYKEGVFPVRVINNTTKEVVITNIARADGEWMTEDYVPFSFVIDADITEETPFILRFDKANLSELSDNYDYASLSVNLKPYKLVTEEEIADVKVFFPNSKLNPDVKDCKLVYPVTRSIPKTETIEKATLNELIKGLTQEDKDDGYFTYINNEVKVLDFSIENNILRVNFSKELDEEVSGSCMVDTIKAQIEETLKQFDTIDSVIISIEGKTEGILQP